MYVTFSIKQLTFFFLSGILLTSSLWENAVEAIIKCGYVDKKNITILVKISRFLVRIFLTIVVFVRNGPYTPRFLAFSFGVVHHSTLRELVWILLIVICPTLRLQQYAHPDLALRAARWTYRALVMQKTRLIYVCLLLRSRDPERSSPAPRHE